MEIIIILIAAWIVILVIFGIKIYNTIKEIEMTTDITTQINELNTNLQLMDWENCDTPYIHKAILDELQANMNIAKCRLYIEIRLQRAQEATNRVNAHSSDNYVEGV